MANAIEIRNLIQTTLNTNVTDPFPTGNTRRGNHFFSENDGINFNRGDTFPKGYIRQAETRTLKSPIGRTGLALQFINIDIHYYVKEKNSYTVSGTTYKNQDLVTHMLEQVRTVLLNNTYADYKMHPESVQAITSPEILDTGSLKLYWGVIPITYYWYEEYGNV